MGTGLSNDNASLFRRAFKQCGETAQLTPVTILLAEDDKMLRTFAEIVLEREGFTVIPVSNGEAALEVFRSGTRVDALLTDAQMDSEFTGIMLAEHIRNERPGLRVLVMSGFPETARLASEKNLPFLAKPFLPDQLVRRMRQVLALTAGP